MFYNCMRIISRVIDICSWCTEVITSQSSVCRGDVSDITPHSATPVIVRQPDTRYSKLFCTEYCIVTCWAVFNSIYVMQVDKYFASSPSILILLLSSLPDSKWQVVLLNSLNMYLEQSLVFFYSPPNIQFYWSPKQMKLLHFSFCFALVSQWNISSCWSQARGWAANRKSFWYSGPGRTAAPVKAAQGRYQLGWIIYE